jgi:hypothetical protein
MPVGVLEGPPRIAQRFNAFQRWVWTPEGLSPEGRADSAPIQPSLSGLGTTNVFPSVETLGYSHPSLRDEQDQILVALTIPVCRVADIPVGRL